MTTILYDGTFQGLLTVVFEVFEYKFINVEIHAELVYNAPLFGNEHKSLTDDVKAARVWRGLSEKISQRAQTNFYRAFLSEQKGIENALLKYAQYVFDNKQCIENNFANQEVLTVFQTAKKVDREKHRMEAFVRFQLTKDGLYYAICQPDFNVLPLLVKHFKERFADQKWLIYDGKRKYGIYYDLITVETVHLAFLPSTNNGKSLSSLLDEKEALYQQLWQQYFSSVNIEARKNLKLHIQHMPKRYWNFLPEKRVAK